MLKDKQSELSEESEILFKQFSRYLKLAVRYHWIAYMRKQQAFYDIHEMHEDIEMALENKRDVENQRVFFSVPDPYTEYIQREPLSWDALVQEMGDPKLQSHLRKLNDKEAELMFYRIIADMSFKDINRITSEENSEGKIKTIIRKIRRWIQGGKQL